MKEKLITSATGLASIGGIELIAQLPTDPSFYSELFKLILQIIIAVISIFKLLPKKGKNGSARP